MNRPEIRFGVREPEYSHGAGFNWPMLKGPLFALCSIAVVVIALAAESRVPLEQRQQNLESSQAYP